MREMIWLTFIAWLMPLADARAAESIHAVGFFLEQNQPDKAIRWLEETLSDGDLSKEERESLHFALGKLLYERELDDSSERNFAAISQKSEYEDWADLYLGKIARRNKDFKKAERYLNPLIGNSKPVKVRMEARAELSQLHMVKGNWKTAGIHLQYLERRTRGEAEHAEYVWSLIKTEMKRGRSSQVCYWARKFYAGHPEHPSAADWGIDLKNNEYEGRSLGCRETSRDRSRRIKRLQLVGLSDRARSEVDLLVSRKKDPLDYETDILAAEFLIQEGFSGEALAVLLPHYSSQSRNQGFLMTLAKAAARGGEIKAAIGIYYRAYEMAPRNRSSRTALFQAAFLSYQYQDYDGASRKFAEFVKRYSHSGLSRDAVWYMAWIKYLKGNYSGAVASLKELLKDKKRRRRWWRSFPEDKAEYWLAMSHFKMNAAAKAVEELQKLNGNSLRSYYSLLAAYRLTELMPDGQLREIASVPNEAESEQEVADEMAARTFSDDEESSSGKIAEENESEEVIDRLEDGAAEEPEAEVEAGDTMPPDSGILVEQFVDYFKDSRLGPYFHRAKKFTYMGFKELAKWELYEVERRTRDPLQLNAIAYQYNLIGAYHRSAYIGEVNFVNQRSKFPMREAEAYWKYAYPQAFESTVTATAAAFSVPAEFIWSIIRAESRYRPDVRSPVGATGLMQLMPFTARRLSGILNEEFESVQRLTEPEVNIRLGSRYLRRLLNKFDNRIPLAAAGYNAGPHRVDSWLHSFGRLDMDEFIEHIPFAETRNYVKKVVRNFHIYNELYASRKAATPWLIETVGVTPTSSEFQRENWDEKGI